MIPHPGCALGMVFPMSNLVTWSELDHSDRELVESAQQACARAYAPYSLFAVGAAVRSRSGKIYTAANIENAAFGLSICAEASALSVANAAGDFTAEAIAVVGFDIRNAGGVAQIVTPCGSCRQIIAEAARVAESDVRVLCCNGELSSIITSSIAELLPSAFGPSHLGTTAEWRLLHGELQAKVERLIARRKSQ
jgi:cytidine deaminase